MSDCGSIPPPTSKYQSTAKEDTAFFLCNVLDVSPLRLV